MFQPFAIEQYMSDHEQNIEFHFSESGVLPVKFGELLELAGLGPATLADVPINYPEVNGFQSLREIIAGFYPGAGPDNVLVTVGASEANIIIAQTLFHDGGELVTMQPTYLQIAGAAQNLGANVTTVPLPCGRIAGWLPMKSMPGQSARVTKSRRLFTANIRKPWRLAVPARPMVCPDCASDGWWGRRI